MYQNISIQIIKVNDIKTRTLSTASILAIRYIFICHPMKATTLLSKPRHVLFCVTSTILAVLSSCIHLYEQIIQRNSLCYPEYLRKANIIMFTLTVVFFVIPAASCMALFVEIWLALRKMLTHQERNEQISKVGLLLLQEKALTRTTGFSCSIVAYFLEN